jgi:hypothetical protein
MVATLNREVYVTDPYNQELLNNGVAEVQDSITEEERRTLRYELNTFVCDGQYATGLRRILESYLDNLGKPEQPAVWVSGFFGSGKSHLVKMLRALWVNFTFPEDQATARDLADLDTEVSDLLTALSTAGRRGGGLHAAAGTLGSSAKGSVRLALLSIVFKSAGLPEQYPRAKFVMWLRDNDCLDAVKAYIGQAGKVWEKELANMYVSPLVGKALVNCFPGFTTPAEQVSSLLKEQFPNVSDISDAEMNTAIQSALAPDGQFPCTLIALDEVQQYIGDDTDISYAIQEITEECSKHFKGQLLFVATGQTALSGTPALQRLQARFKISIELSDQDVDTVIRQIILRKKPDHIPQLETYLTTHLGEISRHLSDTRIASGSHDEKDLVPDYPLLPSRRRFWERILRAVDSAGTQGQLRNQLKIVYEATRSTADKPLGWVVGGDFIYFQLATDLLKTAVLPREIHDMIAELNQGSPRDQLKARLCALAFLIGKLPQESSASSGVKATAEILADLLVEDLNEGSSGLRNQVPTLLQELVDGGQLLQHEAEFRVQTRESSAWDTKYREFEGAANNNPQLIADDRTQRIENAFRDRIKNIKLTQGLCKESRKLVLHFGQEAPPSSDLDIPVWIRDGWQENSQAFETSARTAGSESPTIFVFIPNRRGDELQRQIITAKAARETINAKGTPTTTEGEEARVGMETRLKNAEDAIATILGDLFTNAVKVYQAGGQEVVGLTLETTLEQAAQTSMVRLFREFDKADSPKWDTVLRRARDGNGDALKEVGYSGESDQHPVCKEIIDFVMAGKRGNDVLRHFSISPYGWPKDAIDACLYVLLVGEHMRATQNGQAVTYKQLDRRQVGQTEFRVEAIVISVGQKIALRGLFQNIGVACKSNEESEKARIFLQQVASLAYDAGGDPPCPMRPVPGYVQDLLQRSGNEQLQAVYNAREQMAADITTWQEKAQQIQDRLPQWQVLEDLAALARSVPEAQPMVAEAEAIRDGRLLLQTPDPVKPLCDQLTQILREKLLAAQTTFREQYESLQAELEAQDSWQQLSVDDRDRILQAAGLSGTPEVQVGTVQQVQTSLQRTPLTSWANLTAALSEKFAQARLKAEQQLRPKAQPLKLPSQTLSTPEEAEQWLSQARQLILEKLQNGPVIL